MYIPTIFMGKDANEETPEKNSMDWLGECPQSTRLAIDFWMFGQGPMDPMGFWPRSQLWTVQISRSNMGFFSWVNPSGMDQFNDQAIWLP